MNGSSASVKPCLHRQTPHTGLAQVKNQKCMSFRQSQIMQHNKHHNSANEATTDGGCENILQEPIKALSCWLFIACIQTLQYHQHSSITVHAAYQAYQPSQVCEARVGSCTNEHHRSASEARALTKANAPSWSRGRALASAGIKVDGSNHWDMPCTVGQSRLNAVP